MGTQATVLLAHDGAEAEALLREALAAIRDVERRMTRFVAASEIGRVNGSPGTAFPVSAETATVVGTALEVARASDGRFDPGLGVPGELWGFYDRRRPARLPDAGALRSWSGGAAYRAVELLNEGASASLRLRDGGVQLDLGGIAKGFAVDRAVRRLRAGGVRHALINVGGDLYALGSHPDGRPWQVGVRHPRVPGEFVSLLSLRDTAVATSGDYENFFVAQGRRFHHLLDPRTGRPARFHQSVTVTARSVMMADALATAAFASPRVEARRLLKRLSAGRWLAVDAEGSVYEA
jgi:thiamine biosynthesis lipoprotein